MTEKETETGNRPFRVVVVGCGLLGLTAAHILAKTDMDFVILEQHDDLLPEIGSLLALLPPTFRVLDQLDLLDAVTPVLNRVVGGVFMSAATARVFREEDVGRLIETNHGHPNSIAHRPHYVKALYDSLPAAAKARIRVRKRVERIEVDAEGVSVHCADGTVERGDVVVGADGVHSITRRAVLESLPFSSQGNKSATTTAMGQRQQQPQSPFVTTYRMLFGNLPALPDLPAGVNFEGAAPGVSTQIITGESRAWFALYERLADGPTTSRVRWSEEDKAAILRARGHLYLAPGYTLADAHRLARGGDVGLINLEEGLLERWCRGRVVLVGDAVRKLEPHSGLGYNSGVADLVVLVNLLRRLLLSHRGIARPTTGDLEAVFRAYQAQRRADSLAAVAMSERRARMCGWLGLKDRFLACVVVPLFPLGAYGINRILGPVLARAPVLDWLDEKHLPARAVPYLHHPRTEAREKVVYRGDETVATRLPLLTVTVAVAALAATVGLRLYRRI